MAIENWVDELVKVAGSVASHTGRKVRAYAVFHKQEFPEALSEFPCAITFGFRVSSSYSDSGPCIDLWEGITEFHLFPDTKKTNIPEALRYFGRIRNAYALRRRLGGLVEHMLIREEGMSLVTAQYGAEDEHHAIVVPWQVKERVTAEITLGQ